MASFKEARNCLNMVTVFLISSLFSFPKLGFVMEMPIFFRERLKFRTLLSWCESTNVSMYQVDT